MLGSIKDQLLVSEQDKQTRKSICLSCEFLQPPLVLSQTSGVCGKCGCWIDNKIQFKQQNCPIMKW